MIDVEDVKLRSWGNEPYIYKSIPIKPKTIKEIIRDGYQNFLYNLNLVAIDKEQVFPDGNSFDTALKKLSFAELLYATENFDFLNSYLDAIQYFLSTEISVEPDKVILINENKYTLEDIASLVVIIKIQNCMSNKSGKDEFNPKNDRVRKLKEQQQRYKDKIAKLKTESQKEDNLSFRDYLSSLAVVGNGMNVNEVLKLNYYQFHDQLIRLQKYQSYKENMDALFHQMLDTNKTKITHWMTKIE
ncbi:hypothetical protein [Paenibacillus sp. Marseille-Q4541]|uniref:hypothetical protein n=1 Tax=Paenibacillus sp. Marseille-Q4541 TaxID=2831522 RepID=UPI001BA7021A|nr:hypothetical protein [Paenibacillus sp. Marseille-Q4541]